MVRKREREGGRERENHGNMCSQCDLLMMMMIYLEIYVPYSLFFSERAIMLFYLVLELAFFLHIDRIFWHFYVSIVVEVFREVVFGLLDTTRQLHVVSEACNQTCSTKFLLSILYDLFHSFESSLCSYGKSLLRSLERAAGGIGLPFNADKTEFLFVNQRGDIFTLNGRSDTCGNVHLPRIQHLISQKGYQYATSEGCDSCR